MTSPNHQDSYSPAIGAPDGCPEGLLEALSRRSASVVAVGDYRSMQRAYMRATSPSGDFFAWFGTDACQCEIASYELEVRRLIGTSGPLRSLQPLEAGENWRLERWIEPQPFVGARALEATVAAAEEMQRLRLPKPRGLCLKQSRRHALNRRLRVVSSPLATRDYLRARAMLAATRLPLVTSHGDFHLKHILLEDDVPWIIDWELSSKRPAGFDLLYLWSDLESEEDRDLIFEMIVEMIGRRYRKDLLRLRYALLVRMIAAKLSDPEPFARDESGALRLLRRLLPPVRLAAGV